MHYLCTMTPLHAQRRRPNVDAASPRAAPTGFARMRARRLATPIKRKSENLIMDSINFAELKSLVFVAIKFNVFSSGTKCRSARNTCCIVNQRQPRFSFKYCCGCSDNVPATSERRTPLRPIALESRSHAAPLSSAGRNGISSAVGSEWGWLLTLVCHVSLAEDTPASVLRRSPPRARSAHRRSCRQRFLRATELNMYTFQLSGVKRSITSPFQCSANPSARMGSK